MARSAFPQVSLTLSVRSRWHCDQGLRNRLLHGFDQWTYAAKDVLTKVHGAHTMKMGANLRACIPLMLLSGRTAPAIRSTTFGTFLNDAADIAENAQSDPQTGVPSALRKIFATISSDFFSRTTIR